MENTIKTSGRKWVLYWYSGYMKAAKIKVPQESTDVLQEEDDKSLSLGMPNPKRRTMKSKKMMNN